MGNPTTADGGPPPFDKGGYAAKDRTGRLDENTRAVFDAIGRAFDVDVEYVESLDDGSWGRMETALRRMTISAESANPLSTAIHEQVHLMKAIAPEAYKALEGYTMWALDQEGADVDAMINRKIAQYEGEAGFGYNEAVEELVCDATENIQNADDFEGRFAQFLSEEGYTHSEAKAVVEKIAEFFRKIRDALKSVLDSLRARHGDNVTVTEAGATLSANIDVANRQLELFLALSRMSKQRYAEIRAGMADMPEGVVKYSRQNYFVEDKYFRSQISKWETLKHGGYVKVGEIGTVHPLYKVGMPAGVLRYDVSKLKRNMSDHGDYLTVKLLNAVPDIIANPVAISEYIEENTVSVFGDVFVGKSPLMVGVTISKDNAGNDISKIRTFNARKDVGRLITDETVLYLNENKKETRNWFLACGIQVPLGESRFGFIRSISQNAPDVNRKSQKAPDSTEVEKLKAQVAKRDGRISQQSEVIDKLKTVVERGDAGTIPYEKLRSGMKSILREYSSKYSLETAAARASEIFGRIKNVRSSVEQRAIYRDVLALALDITSAAEAKTKDSAAFTADCAAFLKDVRKGIAITETQRYKKSAERENSADCR